MLNRRRLLGLSLAVATTLSFGAVVPAEAFTLQPYDAAAVDAAIKSGRPVVVHVYAGWCLQCHAQASILKRLSAAGRYEDIAFFRVDYDKQKDVVKALDVPRSTLIAFRGGKEVDRMSWGTSEASVVAVLDAAG
ncbi:Thiol-disulfide isomerase or thioredoxin [Kaistia soli DSM 19436]|uniref:Thiol-disulfide isomerase or thioredoxin n=1 Tax=Kaistia soli DSM 19436 TaxID=1122133 RepID=A0A1M4X0J2_9HYPH|nr:thioredoxin family protein [Kaistia soli]SHE87009.1 Thiol-disulfide isomerase or thioredoxin [Kaistia soli DSM 19436]